MTVDAIEGTPLGTLGLSLDEDHALSLLLLYELRVRREASRWYPHLRLLPREVGNAVCFNDGDIEALQVGGGGGGEGRGREGVGLQTVR